MAVILTGDQGNCAFTSGTSNVILTNLDIDYWEFEERRPAFSFKPFQYIMPKKIIPGKDGRGRFRAAAMSGTTPPVVGDKQATTATLTLTHKSGQTIVFKAIITGARRSANSTSGEPQTVTYDFEACADSNTDDIVAT
jgi:hypothetical protein